MNLLIRRLKKVKARDKLTFRELAEDLGVSLDTLFRWFRDENNPSNLARDRIKEYLELEE